MEKRGRSRGGRGGSSAAGPASRPARSNLTVLLGVTAVFLGLGSLLIRFWRGEGMGLGAILAIVFGVVAVALSGRLREVGE